MNIDWSDFFEPILQLLDGFNYFVYTILKNGNYLLFVTFLIMSGVLILNAREKEYDEKVHGKEEMVKSRGRIGMAIYFLLGFAFLSRELIGYLYKLFELLPEPAILVQYMHEITSISLNNVHTLDIGGRTLFFLISFLSLVSILLVLVGIYLLFFNKFIIQSKLKFMVFLAAGFLFWILFGFKTSLRLMI